MKRISRERSRKHSEKQLPSKLRAGKFQAEKRRVKYQTYPSWVRRAAGIGFGKLPQRKLRRSRLERSNLRRKHGKLQKLRRSRFIVTLCHRLRRTVHTMCMQSDGRHMDPVLAPRHRSTFSQRLNSLAAKPETARPTLVPLLLQLALMRSLHYTGRPRLLFFRLGQTFVQRAIEKRLGKNRFQTP